MVPYHSIQICCTMRLWNPLDCSQVWLFNTTWSRHRHGNRGSHHRQQMQDTQHTYRYTTQLATAFYCSTPHNPTQCYLRRLHTHGNTHSMRRPPTFGSRRRVIPVDWLTLPQPDEQGPPPRNHAPAHDGAVRSDYSPPRSLLATNLAHGLPRAQYLSQISKAHHRAARGDYSPPTLRTDCLAPVARPTRPARLLAASGFMPDTDMELMVLACFSGGGGSATVMTGATTGGGGGVAAAMRPATFSVGCRCIIMGLRKSWALPLDSLFCHAGIRLGAIQDHHTTKWQRHESGGRYVSCARLQSLACVRMCVHADVLRRSRSE